MNKHSIYNHQKHENNCNSSNSISNMYCREEQICSAYKSENKNQYSTVTKRNIADNNDDMLPIIINESLKNYHKYRGVNEDRNYWKPYDVCKA